ncbi:MAG: glycosyltransferase family 4 protein [Roseiflexus sp.]|nr:glycosyltransferase family 4 protein [Roseiflexus sp.]MCS7289792.1 glycosyltransferase family 4 protein [Roseiflexus sp.]MDW8145725.1 glycosyltransferase [Roseiflexaceae bacterium]MDW8232493.1 glycosyltransferase [Roseiflexaceae bacterium]
MRVVVPLEHHFDRTPDGVVWTQTQFPYRFWQRYLEVFDQVRVVARVRDVPRAAPDWQRADGRHVSFAAVPEYVGPRQYLLRLPQILAAVRGVIGAEDAVILRVSSQIASLLYPSLRREGRPYGVEVVSDPYNVFAPGAVRHPLRPFFRWLFPYQLRRQCAHAAAACYVTEHALQRRYPCPSFSVAASDVELPDEAIVSAPRPLRVPGAPFRLVFVGSLGQLYKAPDVLLDAVALCVRAGVDLTLTLLGDGKHRPELEERARRLGIADRVVFRGQVTAGAAVRAALDAADLFVLPSRHEGMPRAMIEAMARALPCIGSTVGGIPELLPPEDLVPPGDAPALAERIREMLASPERMTQASARNLERARAFAESRLRERRLAFFRYVREQTEAWLAERCTSPGRQERRRARRDEKVQVHSGR